MWIDRNGKMRGALGLMAAAMLTACPGGGGGSTESDGSSGGEASSGDATTSQTTTTTNPTSTTVEPTSSTTVEPTSSTTVEPTSTSTTDDTSTTEMASTGPAPFCGDGEINGSEECDDGAENGDTKACTSMCMTNICGDALVLEGSEECDDGNALDNDACTAACKNNVCGDGFVNEGVEACDDGNLDDGDGCDAMCVLETCGDNKVTGMEECDDGNAEDTDACTSMCLNAKCGDGFTWAGMETCDDGNPDQTDMCTTLCKAPACDDTIKSGAETDVDCGGATCAKCADGKACKVAADCASNVCKAMVCVPQPKTCKEIKMNNPQAPDGMYPLDLDGNPMTMAVNMWCDMTTDGGGWTVFYAATGANAEQAMVSNTEVLAGNPIAFQHFNVNREKKVQLSGLSTETIFVRNNMTWLKADDPAFTANLTMANFTHKVPVMITANNGMSGAAFMGFATGPITGGGDFGISQSPDGPTCNGMNNTMTGFDHSQATARMLNCDCDRQYLYSRSTAILDSDAGYDVELAFGSWAQTQANCLTAAAEGGALIFYAAMR